MSALYHMISALVAMLIAFALSHFGVSERPKTPAPPPASQAPAQNPADDNDQDQHSS